MQHGDVEKMQVESIAAYVTTIGGHLRLVADFGLVAFALDVNALVARIDVNALLSRLDLDKVMRHVDIDAVVGRVDVNEIAGRIDMDALVDETDLGAVIAKSSGGFASEALDAPYCATAQPVWHRGAFHHFNVSRFREPFLDLRLTCH
jgi:hypothetical protein